MQDFCACQLKEPFHKLKDIGQAGISAQKTTNHGSLRIYISSMQTSSSCTGSHIVQLARYPVLYKFLLWDRMKGIG